MKKLMPFAFSLLAACGGPPTGVDEKDPDDLAAVDESVMVVMDDEVKWGIELLEHRAQKLPDGRLRVQLRFRNKTPDDLHLQLAWTFKDDSNFSVEAESPFEHVLMAAGQTRDLARDSLSVQATKFHVQVKTAKTGED
jgi:hypothetical protein